MKRLYKIYLIIFMSLLTGAPASANEVTAILPYPNHICWKKGTFDMGDQVKQGYFTGSGYNSL